ncbi:MAG: phosphatase PAP2 family protein [Luteimonas sp.]
MSTAGTEPPLPAGTPPQGTPPHTPAEAARAARDEARFGAAFLRAHWGRLLLVFAGVWLPLWGFGALVEELREGEAFPFDAPMLQLAHALARDGLDRAFLLVSRLGYGDGVVPIDVVLVLALAWRRRMREGLFAGLALAGSALLNVAAKHVYARARPDLWVSIAPETTYSFPSGHAMGSMTLGAVAILLAWRTPWRWPIVAAAAVFVPLVGLSRVYLGVHYPSDILAGWAAACGWTVACYALVFSGRRPWQAGTGRAG